MGSFRIEPDEILGQFLVELTWILEEMKVPVNEFFLNGAIKSFTMRIHLGSLWIRIPMNHARFLNLFLKGLHELRTIVGEDSFDLVWKALKNGLEDMGCFFRTVAFCGKGEGEPGMNINGCDEISSCSMNDLLDRIEGNTFPRL